ncbi:carboxypeptidase-like regulatory domain-containing protein [Polluticaenibacter yanchengensis]|uniref:Carboxypeptidase-like regulatory domain-containing protein n=1 Tax=Polluticaenibacter yanchengensis TaxID=3014562 RepID=A0ABT4UEX6_9BACT|nr:carboxypeptidase-like regulatory domain-containing protein [Chitinophagaceae bacterium LY-5]
MKYIFYSLLIALTSCKTANNFYQGKVTDQNNQPLEDVIVIEEDRAENQTKTDKTGYFKLNRNPDWIGRLVFIKEGYTTDTIPAVSRQAGESIAYNFIQKDTTIVRLIPLNNTAYSKFNAVKNHLTME